MKRELTLAVHKNGCFPYSVEEQITNYQNTIIMSQSSIL